MAMESESWEFLDVPRNAQRSRTDEGNMDASKAAKRVIILLSYLRGHSKSMSPTWGREGVKQNIVTKCIHE